MSDWRERAACGVAVRNHGVDPDLWIPTTRQGSRTTVPPVAAQLCGRCTETARCARLVLTLEQPVGVWAGVALGTDPTYRARALEQLRAISAEKNPAPGATGTGPHPLTTKE